MTWLDLHRYTHLWHVFELDIHKRPCMVLDTVWYQMAECTETSSLWAGGISRCDWCDWLKGHGWGLVKNTCTPQSCSLHKSLMIFLFRWKMLPSWQPTCPNAILKIWRWFPFPKMGYVSSLEYIFAPWEDTSRTAYPVRFHRESIHFQPFSVKAMLAWCAGMFFLPPRVFRGAFSL